MSKSNIEDIISAEIEKVLNGEVIIESITGNSAGDEAIENMIHNIIHHEVRGIICDDKSCGHYIDMPKSDLSKWINAPCPKCGRVMLTQEHYDQYMSISQFVEAFDEVFPGK